jgi:hypothetical protein
MAKRKPYSEMTAAQLREATRQYDAEWTGPGLPGKPLTARDQTHHKRARGRPKVGSGAKIVPISVERDLLSKADAFARRHKLKRSQMVAQGLKLVMKAGAA